MNDDKSDDHIDRLNDVPESDDGGAPMPGLGIEASELQALLARTEEIEAERNELKDRLLRMLAEAENLKKRTQREVADAKRYAVASFARDVLGVGDNMARALDAKDGDKETLIEGVEMTQRELERALEKHGVIKLDPQGERFDPNMHQAMFEVPGTPSPAGTVVQVMQAGYRIGERVLRPAMVGVAKGEPVAAPPQAAAPEAEPDDDRPHSPGARIDRTI